MSNKFKLIIFDWDGTLIDSTTLIGTCMRNAFQDLHLLTPTMLQAKNIIGLGLHEAVLALKPDANSKLVSQIAAAYRVHFFKSQQTRDNLFTGVISVLTWLQANNFQLAIATGKSRRGLNKDFISTQLAKFFTTSRCADETKSKPEPLMLLEITSELNIKPKDSLMVGDTEYDLAMAANFNMPSIGVSYGAHDKSRLLKYRPIACIDNIKQLLDYV